MPGKKAANYIIVGMQHTRFQKTFSSLVMRRNHLSLFTLVFIRGFDGRHVTTLLSVLMGDAEVESKDELASLEADQEVLYVTLNTRITKVSGSLASTTATARKT